MMSFKLSVLGALLCVCFGAKNQTCFYVTNKDNESVLDKLCIDDSVASDLAFEVVSADDSSDLLFGQIANGTDLDFLWVLICGAMVFLMQAGFTVLEAGSVKASSLQNILFKNLMDACCGAVLFWLVGYAVAYGPNGGTFSGIGYVGLKGVEDSEFNAFFFQWAFAATAATIVSGSVAERCTHTAYFTYTALLTAWVYPVVAHWVWSDDGFLAALGVIDFAGSGVVHMVGGCSGLMGAIFLGPRIGRFPDGTGNEDHFNRRLQKQLKFGNSVPLQVIGALILWFGWYGFNPGSTLAAVDSMTLASKVAVTTTLAAAAGGVFTACAGFYLEGHFMVPRVVNGILAGLVSITAPCSVVGPGDALAIGFIGGIIYYTTSRFLDRIQVDDPLDAFPVHGACGAWGVLSVALFATEANIAFAGYDTDVFNSLGKIFSHQLLAVVLIAVWTCGHTAIVFALLKFLGVLRVPAAVEKVGLDPLKHGNLQKPETYKFVNTASNSTKPEGNGTGTTKAETNDVDDGL